MTQWVDGDYLTPANLNAKGAGAVFTDRTVNAANYTGATNEAKITAAIAGAVLLGYSSVFVPASMLPYNATLVTFNDSVVMVREGQGSWTELDALAYGAAGTGTEQYDSANLQEMFDRMYRTYTGESTTGGGWRTVRLPSISNTTRYALNKPLWIRAPGSRLIGPRQGYYQGPGNPQLYPGYRYGPALFIGAGSLTVPNIVSQLLTGTGSAWKIIDDNSWFNLRDATTLDIHGLSQFCIEVAVSSTDGSAGAITSSDGYWLVDDATTLCYRLAISGGVFQFILKTSVTGTTTIYSTTPIVAGTRYRLRADYDGSTVRLFVEGILEGSSAATGTLVQVASQDVTVGPGTGRAPDQSRNFSAAKCTVDGLHISDISRGIVNYAPSGAKPTKDTHTLALMNFDTQYGPFTRVDTKNGDLWAWCRQQGVGACVGCEVEGIVISGSDYDISGIMCANNVNGLNLSRLSIYNYRNAIYIPMGDSYFWRAQDIDLSAGQVGARYGFLAGGNAGLATLTNFQGVGGMVPLALMSPGVTASGVYILSSPVNSLMDVLLLNNSLAASPYVFNSCAFSTETGGSIGWRGTVCIGVGGGAYGTGAVFQGCGFEMDNDKCAIVSDAHHVLINSGCTFLRNGSPSSIMEMMGIPNAPAIFNGCEQVGTWLPWSNIAGTALIGKIGKGAAITFSATPTFSADARDAFEITLTGNVTSSTLQYHTPGQRLSWRIIQSGGPWTFAWPANVKGGGTVGTGSNVQEFEVGLDSNAYAVSAMVVGM